MVSQIVSISDKIVSVAVGVFTNGKTEGLWEQCCSNVAGVAVTTKIQRVDHL